MGKLVIHRVGWELRRTGSGGVREAEEERKGGGSSKKVRSWRNEGKLNNSAKYFAIKKELKRGSQKRGSSQGCQVQGVAGSGPLSPYHRGPIGVQRTVADPGPPLLLTKLRPEGPRNVFVRPGPSHVRRSGSATEESQFTTCLSGLQAVASSY